MQYVFHSFHICSGGNEAADVFLAIRVPCGFIEGKVYAFFFDRFHGVVWMMWWLIRCSCGRGGRGSGFVAECGDFFGGEVALADEC